MNFKKFKRLKTHKPASPQNSTLETVVGLYSRGKYAEAVSLVEKLLRVNPNDVTGLNLAAACSFALGNLSAAEDYLLKAVKILPDNADIHNNIGNLFAELKRFPEAEASYQRALSLRSGYAEAHYNFANLFAKLKRFPEAETSYQRALSIRPDYAEAHYNLANLFVELMRFPEAEASYQHALSIRSDHAKAHNNLGNLFVELMRVNEAETSYRRALSIHPNYAEAHKNLGDLLDKAGHLEAAESCYSEALKINPDFDKARLKLRQLHQKMCKWKGMEKEDALLLDCIKTKKQCDIQTFPLLFIPGINALQLREYTRRFTEQTCGQFLLQDSLHYTTPKAPIDRLRIGYLSADFRDHVISFQLAEIIELHDRSKFEILGYSCGPDDQGLMRKRIRSAFDQFRDIQSFPTNEAAQKIAADAVDILIDLQGFTQFNRHQIFALRPAPIQVNWLGYPGTMGHERLADYLIGDPVITPLTHEAFYSETLALMPCCYMPNDLQRKIGPSLTRVMFGLPEHGFVFCSFNTSPKITPAVFDLWCSLLKTVPESVLWLREDKTITQENLRSEARMRGVSKERLIFTGRLPQAEEHLARIRLADLMLDTFPYTGHATTSDALWVGLPVVTCIGETFASRVAASLLHAAHIPELVTTTFDNYFQLALELAKHPGKLSAVKDKLASHRLTCPLFDSKGFTRNLERLYEQMWANHLCGRKEPIVLSEEG